ncbi:MAG: PilN domain-containing protein [Acidobacteriota bacterium]
MIKINLVREGRAVRGAGAAPASQAPGAAAGGTGNLNNSLMIGLLILGLLAAGGYWFFEKSQLAKREQTVRERRAEADKLEAIIKDVESYQKRKDSLQRRIDLINQLKQNQKGPVRILDQISRDLPDLVWLDRMTINNGAVAISGRGLNPNAVANLVENVKNDSYFEEPELNNLVQATAVPPVYTFDMTFHFSYTPKTGTSTGGGAATGTAGTTGTSTTSTSTTAGARPRG